MASHKKERAVTDQGSPILRGVAVLFALMLLICLPIILLTITFSPGEFFQHWQDPVDTLVKSLALIIGGLIVMGALAAFRSFRS